MTAAVAPKHRVDRVEDWLDELGDVVESVASYPAAARQALCGVLQSFLEEGGHRPEHAAAIHDALRALRAGTERLHSLSAAV